MIHDGKAEEGFAWAIKVSKYLNETSDLNVRVLRNIAGHVSQVHWVANFESLADMETSSQKLEADTAYQAMLKEIRGLNVYVYSSMVINIHQTVS